MYIGKVKNTSLYLRFIREARIGVSLLFLLVLACSFASPAPDEDEEYNLKAAFIYRFTNYIDWGPYGQGSEFVIGIAGPSPVSRQLMEIAKSKTVKDKKIVVRQFSKLEEIGSCQILFIPQKSSIRLEDILARTAGKGILTISEKAGYARKGTGINFVEVDNNLKFEANAKGITAEGLKASSQLLKLAIIVD